MGPAKFHAYLLTDVCRARGQAGRNQIDISITRKVHSVSTEREKERDREGSC